MDMLDFNPSLLLSKLVSNMGCVCLKPSVNVEGIRYKVLRQVAEGGFSTVDLVQDTGTGKKYALKRIVCHSVEDQNLAQKEVEITRNLNHPGIVRLVGASTVGSPDIVHNITSEVMLVMPFYPRGTLHDELERRKLTNSPLSQTTVISVFSSVCKAVVLLHNTSPVPLAHRDIKPHNVLIERDLSPILMDLGSVSPARHTVSNLKEAQYIQDTASERCSMTYRPPELFQVSSECTLDERTDVWSLGCLLYAIMFYESPFDSVYERGDSVALAVQNGRTEFPSGHNYSQGLLELVTMMMNLDLTFRPRVDVVLDKLENLAMVQEDQL